MVRKIQNILLQETFWVIFQLLEPSLQQQQSLALSNSNKDTTSKKVSTNRKLDWILAVSIVNTNLSHGHFQITGELHPK